MVSIPPSNYVCQNKRLEDYVILDFSQGICCIHNIKKQLLTKYSLFLTLLIQLGLMQLLYLMVSALPLVNCIAVL